MKNFDDDDFPTVSKRKKEEIIEKVKIQKTSPFDIIKNITDNLGKSFEDLNGEESYLPFLINYHFSLRLDTIHFSDYMNRYPDIPVKYQYAFYEYTTPKKKQYTKWPKKSKDNLEIINNIKFLYNVSFDKAKEYFKLLSEEQKEIILKECSEGGLNAKQIKKN